MEYFTYILQSRKDNRLYFGQTQNLQKRLDYHNSGKSTYTKPFTPWNIVAYKSFSSRKEAFSFEKKLKNLKSRERVRKFIKTHEFRIFVEIQFCGSQKVIGAEFAGIFNSVTNSSLLENSTKS